MSKTIKVIEKNTGKKIGYEVEGTTLWIGDQIAIKLPKYQSDTEVTKDICADGDGNLVMGLGKNYVAQVTIPQKEFDYVEQENEETEEMERQNDGKDRGIRRGHLFHLHSMAEEGHSSTHAPQSMHFPASITATSSQVIAPSGQTSTHAPHATHSDSLTDTIVITSRDQHSHRI